MAFGTQLSIDATRDDELMRLVGESGMTWVFIGIETPNEESLKETKKRQNVGVDLVSQVEVFLKHGVAVIGGMIVGFDNDGLDIFERQYEFAMRDADSDLYPRRPGGPALHAALRPDGRTSAYGPTMTTPERPGRPTSSPTRCRRPSCSRACAGSAIPSTPSRASSSGRCA